MACPDQDVGLAGMDALLSLGPYYNRNVRHMRDALRRLRERGAETMVIGLTAPITCPIVEVMLETHALYVLGFRDRTAPFWWEFAPDGDLPPIPGPKRRVKGPTANYANLGLRELTSHKIAPWRLLNELSCFDGRLGERRKCANVITMIFLASEAIRFQSIHAVCYRYISNAERYFQAPDEYYRNPEALDDHTMEFSEATKRIVRNWRTASELGSPDIMIPWPGGGPG